MQNGYGMSYRGPLDVVRQTLAIEGPLAFYKGLSATFVRRFAISFRASEASDQGLWPHTVLLWLAQEAITSRLREKWGF